MDNHSETIEVDDIDKASAKESATNVAKCPSCGASVTFDPNSQKLECAHCGTVVDFEQSYAQEKFSIQNMLKASNPWDKETRVYRCNNCGAVEILLQTEIAKECPYCRTSNIVVTSDLAGLKPSAIVPFDINKDDAGAKAQAWVSKRFFSPKKFKKGFEADNLRGVYNPAFTFDSKTYSTYSGRLGKHYTVTRTTGSGSNQRTYTETHTRWFAISGSHVDMFVDILIQASTKIKQATINKLAPFGIEKAKTYTDNYLFGFSANQYNKDGLACWGEAKSIIEKTIEKSILSRYDYDVVGHINVKTQCNDIKYKYMLLPIYVGAVEYKQKVFNYYVNGVNGKVVGKMPKSAGKITLTVLLSLIAATGIGLLVYFFVLK